MADARRVLADNFLKDRSDLFVAVGVVSVVLMLIIPIPTVLLDALMALNLVFALMILLIVLYTRKATDFNVFPTVLLVSTVFSLALNVSSTRLILSQGTKFNGRMIRAFSTFVVGSGGNEGLVIGFVIFIVIIAVQAMVITKGATRVAEVAARFALDALPGKQMAIEAEYNSGSVSEEAFERKNDLQREVNFCGHGTVPANSFQATSWRSSDLHHRHKPPRRHHHRHVHTRERFWRALSTYTALTIGDGLLSQFPALLVSMATGIIVTRSISDGTFGSDISTQFSRDARIYWIAAAVLGAFAILPGFPWYVLIPLSFLMGFMAYRLGRKEVKDADAAKLKASQAKKAQEEPAEMSPVVPLDPLFSGTWVWPHPPRGPRQGRRAPGASHAHPARVRPGPRSRRPSNPHYRQHAA